MTKQKIHEKKGVDYTEYARRQGRKANNPEKRKILIGKIPNRIKKFEKFFIQAQSFLLPGSILCLGARTGCENKAATNLGFDAVGIDLFPLDSAVLKADWHNIPFENNSFDNVYTNAVDHCYDVERLAKEIHRVLKKGGRFYFQVSKKQMLKTKTDREKYMKESSNFLFWDDGKALADHFCSFNFVFVSEWYDGKWENFVIEAI